MTRNKKGQFASPWRYVNILLVTAVFLIILLFQLKEKTREMEQSLESVREQYAQELWKYDATVNESAELRLELLNKSKWDNGHEVMEKRSKGNLAMITAYSCGGLKNDAEVLMNCPSLLKHPNGRTASGTVPTVYHTVACDRSLLGKVIEISGLGRRVCEDTFGKAHWDKNCKEIPCIDLYVENIDLAFQWGKKTLPYTVE